MLNQFTTWLQGLFIRVFTAAWDFLADAIISIFTLFLQALASLVAAIPVPDFMSTGLAAFWGQLPGGMLYLLTACGAVQALSLLGAGFSFRLLRKLFTLFQW